MSFTKLDLHCAIGLFEVMRPSLDITGAISFLRRPLGAKLAGAHVDRNWQATWTREASPVGVGRSWKGFDTTET